MPRGTHFLLFFLISLSIMPATAAENSTVAISGTIRGGAGAPLAGARISVLNAVDEWTTRADEQGAFQLQVHRDGAFLFVEQEGFRFHGEQLTSSEESFDRQLTPITESIVERLAGQDWNIPTEERLKLLHRVFDPYLEAVLSSENDNDKLRPLELQAQLDPERALEILEEKPFQQPMMSMVVRGRVVEQLTRTDPQLAVEVAEGFGGGYVQAFSFMRIAQCADGMSAPDRVGLLARAAATAKSLQNPGQRIALLGLVSEALLDAGERATAEKLLRETQEVAEKVGSAAWTGFARGAFAEELAQIDVAAALPLVTDLADASERNRHLGNMAHELAWLNPAEAERILNMIEPPADSRRITHERDLYAVRVCYRMATKDLPRAKRIAEACNERNQQGYAYGVIAHAVADEDRALATQLLRRAYVLLTHGERDPKAIKVHASAVGGALLQTAEHIDPTLVREMIWRTISLRTPKAEDPQYAGWSNQQIAGLASWLSRYDRAMATTILEHWYDGGDPTVWTLVDPARAVELAESTDGEAPSRFRLSVARKLVLEGEARVRIPYRDVGLWPIDAEDMDW